MGDLVPVIDQHRPSQSIRVLSQGMTPDSAGVYLVGEAVLKISPPAFPHVVKEMTEKARLARTALGPELGNVIPVPLDEWEENGVTCALFEKLTPIISDGVGGFISRKRIVPHVLRWLRNVAEVERGSSNDMAECLTALASCPYEQLRAAATKALSLLDDCSFVPRSRVMHGDLWLGNILFDRPADHHFTIIDWRGSQVNGIPIFDLIKFAESAKIGSKRLYCELQEHAARLGCSMNDTRAYLLAALGYIWLNLDQFPPDRFAVMALRNLRTLEAALCYSSNAGKPNFLAWQSKLAGKLRSPVSLAVQNI